MLTYRSCYQHISINAWIKENNGLAKDQYEHHQSLFKASKNKNKFKMIPFGLDFTFEEEH